MRVACVYVCVRVCGEEWGGEAIRSGRIRTSVVELVRDGVSVRVKVESNTLPNLALVLHTISSARPNIQA